MTILWNNIFKRPNAVNKSESAALFIIVDLYASLSVHVDHIREKFDEFETEAILKCGSNEYHSTSLDSAIQERNLVMWIVPPLVEKILSAMYIQSVFKLNKRLLAYIRKFGFLSKLSFLTTTEIATSLKKLCKFYPKGVENRLNLECQHLGAHLLAINKK